MSAITLASFGGRFCDCGLCLSGQISDVILRDFRASGRGIQIAIHYRGGTVRRVVPLESLRESYTLARQIARTSKRALYVKLAGRNGLLLESS